MRSRVLFLAALLGSASPLLASAQELPRPGFGLTVGPLDLSATGYFRAPLRLSFRSRGDNGVDGGSGYNIHTPWLVDDDYFRSGFLYTRLQESDWSELYFKVGNKYLTGEVALMGSLYSDWARPLIDRQWGIAQAYLTFRWQSLGPRLNFRMHVRAGSFWDRFGWLENYDTYLFGRTHQMGGQVRLEFEQRDERVVVLVERDVTGGQPTDRLGLQRQQLREPLERVARVREALLGCVRAILRREVVAHSGHDIEA